MRVHRARILFLLTMVCIGSVACVALTSTPAASTTSGINQTAPVTATAANTSAPVPSPTPSREITPTLTPLGGLYSIGPVVSAQDFGIDVQIGDMLIRDGSFAVLVYTIAAPPDLSNWRFLPTTVHVSGQGHVAYPVIQSEALAKVGPLTLAVLSFSYWSPGVGPVGVTLEGFTATEEGTGETRSVEGIWRLEPVSRVYPEASNAGTLRLKVADCVAVEDNSISFDPGDECGVDQGAVPPTGFICSGLIINLAQPGMTRHMCLEVDARGVLSPVERTAPPR